MMDSKATHNNRLEIGGFSHSLYSTDNYRNVVAESFVLRMNFVLRFPPITNLQNVMYKPNGPTTPKPIHQQRTSE